MDCVPDCDLASLPDDLLDVRQNLSQYSYDPADMLDSVNSEAELDGQLNVSSQQSSQASEKLLGFIPFGDATIVNEETADLFECQFDDIHYAYSDSTFGAEHSGALETANYSDVVVDVKSETTAVPVVVDYFGNNIVFDMKSESSDIGTPSVVAHSPDSTNVFNFLVEDDLTTQLSITDDELLKLSTRDLNRRIRLMPVDEQRKLKNRRRTLKNRGYAQTCRTRRVGQRTELETINDRLTAEVKRLTEDNCSLTAECNRLRRERVEPNTEEIELLRANVGFLSNECERLRSEGALFRAERDECKHLLLSLLSSNTSEEVTLQ